jgi:hypothetical protein
MLEYDAALLVTRVGRLVLMRFLGASVFNTKKVGDYRYPVDVVSGNARLKLDELRYR